MKKLELKISSEAFSDLEKIWVYTLKRWSKEQADRYYLLLIDEFEFLRTNYYSGKSADNIRPGYRVAFVKSHIVFYKVESDAILEIIRILHQSMDIEDWLN
jgi:toxin ParE1/3/4